MAKKKAAKKKKAPNRSPSGTWHVAETILTQRKGGRRPAYETEDDFKAAILDYFDHCKDTFTMPNKAGLCYFIRISRDTYNEYRTRYPDAHKEMEQYLENAWVQRLGGTTPTGAIFYLKNAFKDDYKDRHENDTTIRPASLSKDDIGAAIDKLPEKERDALYVHLAGALTGGNSTGSAA